MGKDIPKQFLTINDIPIIIITIKKFLKESNIAYIIVAMNPNWLEYFKQLLLEYNIDLSKVIIINGGLTRFASLCNIVDKAFAIDENSIIVSHNAATPFVTSEIIQENIKAIKTCDAVTTAIPTIESVIETDGNYNILNLPDRSLMYLDQGPQTFRTKEFIDLLNHLSFEDRKKYMEVSKFYLDQNKKVKIVPGERTNFKITTDFDLIVAESLLKNKKLIL